MRRQVSPERDGVSKSKPPWDDKKTYPITHDLVFRLLNNIFLLFLPAAKPSGLRTVRVVVVVVGEAV